MSVRERLPMTARPVKYCLKYVFAIFHDHLSPDNISIIQLKFSD